MTRSGDDSQLQPEHRKVLEEAAADPSASAAELAERIQNVSAEVVQRVLDEHGDSDDDSGGNDTTDEYPNREDIPERQIRTLQAIAAHPDATQRDIASFLDVTAATVSNRVNSLSGFEWDNRREFVKEVLDLDSVPGSDRSVVVDSTEIELQETIDSLIDRVERLERQVGAEDAGSSPFEDPELTRKIVHACMEAEEITDEEEVRILQHFLDR